jgi:transcription elongation factor GreB
MSRAFMKERDDAPEPAMVLERAPGFVPITAAGFRRLEGELERAADPAERTRLERILATVRVVEPPADQSAVAFGAAVTVRGGGGTERYTIVGEDEVDIPHLLIGVESPLARALLGARIGDAVVWHRPAGDRSLTIAKIDYDV